MSTSSVHDTDDDIIMKGGGEVTKNAKKTKKTMRKIGSLLTPSTVFSNEKIRGAITSIVSGGTSGTLNVLGVTVFGLSAPVSALLMLYIFGSFFGYSIDILFAKRNFTIKQGYRGQAPYSGPVPYTDLKARALWLLRSFTEKHFFRFVITIIIDVLIGISLLRALMDFANENQVLRDFRYRDMLLAAAVSVFTFFLYNNVLRFDWAYSDHESPIMNVIVLMWVALVLLVFAVSYSRSTDMREQSSAFYSAVDKNSALGSGLVSAAYRIDPDAKKNETETPQSSSSSSSPS